MKARYNTPTVLQKALSDLRKALEELLGDNLFKARLFGSRARGDAEPDSDVDVMVLVKERTWDMDRAIVGCAADVSLDYDMAVIPLIMTPSELAGERDMETLLYRSLISEGIVI